LPLLIAAVSGPPTAAGLHSDEPLAPLLGVVALLAWVCAGWLLLVLLLAAAARTGSRLAQVAVGQLAPAALRSLLGIAVGTAVAVAVTPGSASADWSPPSPPPSPALELDLDWGQPVATATARPAPTPHPSPVTRPPAPTHDSPQVVLVRPGDSLWRIAARALGPEATDRAVAVAWPSWWRANRELIGTDPDLIHPGAVLVPPSSPAA
jgi:nucleoid-associated protein YgaU